MNVVGYRTVAEVAALRGCSSMTVYRLIACGAISAVRVGRQLLVPDCEMTAPPATVTLSAGVPK